MALTELVYPAATHTRFEHSLGVLDSLIGCLTIYVGKKTTTTKRFYTINFDTIHPVSIENNKLFDYCITS